MIPGDDRETRNNNSYTFNVYTLEVKNNKLYGKMKRIWINLKTPENDFRLFWQLEVHKHAKKSPFNDYEQVVKMYENLQPQGDDEDDGLFSLDLLKQHEKRSPNWRVLPKYELKSKIEEALAVRVQIYGRDYSIDNIAALPRYAYLYEVKVRHDTRGQKIDHPEDWDDMRAHFLSSFFRP
ncbi:hypothetical protein OROHE_006055 [Orobanche hederae]